MGMNLMSGAISSTSSKDTTCQVSGTQCVDLYLHSHLDSFLQTLIYISYCFHD
jgi:hypothetical protein